MLRVFGNRTVFTYVHKPKNAREGPGRSPSLIERWRPETQKDKTQLSKFIRSVTLIDFDRSKGGEEKIFEHTKKELSKKEMIQKGKKNREQRGKWMIEHSQSLFFGQIKGTKGLRPPKI